MKDADQHQMLMSRFLALINILRFKKKKKHIAKTKVTSR